MEKLRIILWGMLIVAAFMLIGCSQNTGEENQTDALPGPESGVSLRNMLVSASGDVFLRRVGWDEFVPVGFGTSVNPGDLIRIETTGQAEVFCGENSLWTEGPYTLESDGQEHGIPCRSGGPPRPWPDTAALRGEDDNFIPYVIAPRDSAILSPTPNLSWFALPDVENYSISLLSDDQKDRPPVEISGARSEWPVSWPPMEVGASYVLLVEGGGKFSDANNQEHARLGFWLLPEEDSKEVSQLESSLQGQSLSPKAKSLMVAELYIQHGLQSEALGMLENIPSAERSASLWNNLGMIYLDIGLSFEAQNAFEQGLVQAQTTGELESEADSLYGLGMVYRLVNDENASLEHLLLAKDIYTTIGSTDGEERVDQLLGE